MLGPHFKHSGLLLALHSFPLFLDLTVSDDVWQREQISTIRALVNLSHLTQGFPEKELCHFRPSPSWEAMPTCRTRVQLLELSALSATKSVGQQKPRHLETQCFKHRFFPFWPYVSSVPQTLSNFSNSILQGEASWSTCCYIIQFTCMCLLSLYHYWAGWALSRPLSVAHAPFSLSWPSASFVKLQLSSWLARLLLSSEM